jgi:hypothetical protein
VTRASACQSTQAPVATPVPTAAATLPGVTQPPVTAAPTEDLDALGSKIDVDFSNPDAMLARAQETAAAVDMVKKEVCIASDRMRHARRQAPAAGRDD